MKRMLREDERRIYNYNRKCSDNCGLWVLRVFTILFNIALVVAGWFAIYYVHVYENFMNEDSQAGVDWLTDVAKWIPAVVMCVLNGLIHLFTEILVYFEKWDYASHKLNHLLVRCYLAKMSNLIVFSLI
jgi:hypothetical protein